MEDLIPLVIVGSFGLLMGIEKLAPARALPRVRFWHLRGVLFFVLLMAVNATLPPIWDAFLGEHALLDLSGLGVAGGAVVGVIGAQLLGYTWHRSMHDVPFLWRWFHQMHHSAERIDVAGAVLFHPLDMIGFAFVSSLALVGILGVAPGAAMIAGTFGAFLSFFQHANVRTPRWLGFLVQRPENHALHHARGIHAHNYGDIALWDMVFGTFRNPEGFPEKAGFHDGASARVGEMLIGRDVSEPRRADAPEGARAAA